MRHRGMAGGSSPLLPAPSLRRGLTASISPWADCYGVDPENYDDIVAPAGLGDAVDSLSPATAPSDVEDGADAQVGVSGLTVTNLLGTYGSFAVDSDGDGLADGLLIENVGSGTSMWSLSSDSVVGNCAQKIEVDGASGVCFDFTTFINTSDVYFLMFQSKSSCADTLWRVAPGTTRFNLAISTGFYGVCAKILTFDTLKFTLGWVTAELSYVANGESVLVDGIQLIDLTADCPDVLSSLCVDPTDPTTAEKEAIEAWCLANLPYHDNTASLTSPVIVSTDSEGNETSKTLTDLTLRSVPAIADVVNPDGTVTRNIAEEVFPNSGYNYMGDDNGTTVRGYISCTLPNSTYPVNMVLRFGEVSFFIGNTHTGDIEAFEVIGNNLYLRILKSRMGTLDAAGFNGAITAMGEGCIRYQLAEPTTDSQTYDNLIPAHDGGTISCAGSSALSIEWPLEASGLKDNTGNRNSLLFGEGASAPTVDGRDICLDGTDDYCHKVMKADLSAPWSIQWFGEPNAANNVLMSLVVDDDNWLAVRWKGYTELNDIELVVCLAGVETVSTETAEFQTNEPQDVWLESDGLTVSLWSSLPHCDISLTTTLPTGTPTLYIGKLGTTTSTAPFANIDFKHTFFNDWDHKLTEAERVRMNLDVERKWSRNATATEKADRDIRRAELELTDAVMERLTTGFTETERTQWTSRIESISGGLNTVKWVNDGADVYFPSVMYVMDQKTNADVLDDSTDTNPHDAFIVGGVTKQRIMLAKHQACTVSSNGKTLALSLRGMDPKVYTTLDQAVSYCANNGTGHHLMTAAEWALLALLAKKGGTQPNGNNSYGNDTAATSGWGKNAAVVYSDKIGRTQTGSGPMAWNHDGGPFGVADLNGNIYEWLAGLRQAAGEIQIIPDNDAADNTVDLTRDSAAWKAIAVEDGTTVDPEVTFTSDTSDGTDAGTHGTCRLSPSTVSGSATLSISTSAANNTAGSDSVYTYFDDVIKDDINVTVMPEVLKRLAIVPQVAGANGHGGDRFYARLPAAGTGDSYVETMARRGGTWSVSSSAGVFALSPTTVRGNSSIFIGFRPAFVEVSE